MKIQTEGAAMNPATPKTERPPSIQLRKPVFGGSRNPQIVRLLYALLAIVFSFLSEYEALGETFDLPFQAANYSRLSYSPIVDLFFTNALTANRRILRFTVLQDFLVDSSSTNNYKPSGSNGILLSWPTYRTDKMSRPYPGLTNIFRNGVVSASSYIGIQELPHQQTLSETVAHSFGIVNRPPLTGPISDVEVRFVIQGGSTAGRTLTLKGKSGYGEQTDTTTDSLGVSSVSSVQLTIALEWGTDIYGVPEVVLILFGANAVVVTQDAAVLPLSDVALELLKKPSALAYAQGLMDEYQAQVADKTLQLMGAVPELLVLYDFSGTNTVLPFATIPRDANLLDENYTFKPCYRYINQYDSGADEGLPSRYGLPGGNACGPTALRMALNTLTNYHSATDLYNNTMTWDMPVANETTNRFEWERAHDWLEGNTKTYPARGPSAGLPAGTHAYPLWADSATKIASCWTRIDQLLAGPNHQPVLLRTDLTIKTNGLGGGHVILLLGKGHSDFVRDAYNLSGDYYVVADPAGHFFANTNGKHYGRMTNLMAQCVGINYGGWFGIYPSELLRARIRNTSSGKDEIVGLTGGVNFPFLLAKARSPVAVVVTDPLGRRTGYQSNGSILEEIPDSWFKFASGDEEDGETFTYLDGIKTVLVNNPVTGLYQVELIGTGTGSFTLDWSGFDGVGTPILQSITDTIAVGQRRTYQFTFGSPPPPTLTIGKVGGQTVVSWPANTLGFVLQSKTNLAVSSTWNTVTNTPATNGGQITVPAIPSRPAEFFRLFKP